MSVKKKATAPSNPKSPGPSAPEERAGAHGATSDSQQSDSGNQLALFEQAVKEFRAQRYHDARKLFEKAIEGRQKEISHNARLHVIMCDRRLEAPVLTLDGLEDHYNYAIERINVRDLDCARTHLQTAVGLSSQNGPSADHLFYALAVCASLAGDLGGAYENLKRAIEIDPKNRLAARNDSDFANVSQQPLVQQLLYPEKFTG